MLTQEKLKELMHYDPDTGKFIRISNGKIAGSLRKDGRFHTGIEGKYFLNSRLAVLWMTGDFPDSLVDHRNRIRSDDRWKNLRSASPSQNLQNRDMAPNSSGVKGVYFSQQIHRYVARIWVSGERKHLGTFETLSDAKEFVELARDLVYGEFANN